LALDTIRRPSYHWERRPINGNATTIPQEAASMPRPLTGAITALATPFRNGKVAYDDLRKLVEHQIKGGIDGISPTGTTGESPTLSHEEHLEVIRAVIADVRGRVPVIAGTGSNSTHEAVELSRLAHEAGADALLVVAPYYNKPSQEGLFGHFSAIADTTDRPIVLYSIPARCGIEIGVALVERLRARYPHVRWIKESGGSVDRVDQLKQALGSDITVLSGDDSLTLPFMSVGAEGVISVASNLAVREVGRMVHSALAGKLPAAMRIHRRLYPLFKALFMEPSPAPIKAALARAGIISSAEVRAPLCGLSPTTAEILDRILKDLGK
jgi:4-hydroxy-tetrahydrodipicolinate synthase